MFNSKTAMRFFIILTTALFAAGIAKAEPSEADRLKQCDRDACDIVQSKTETGTPLKCDLSKSWAKDEIVKALGKRVTWSYGDMKCSIQIELDRASLVSALAAGKNTVKLPPQSVNCEIEKDGQTHPVVIKLAPKLQFKDGKAGTVWLNVDTIEAPAMIRTAVWTVAKMEANLGVFQKDIIKGINNYMSEHCPKTYPVR